MNLRRLLASSTILVLPVLASEPAAAQVRRVDGCSLRTIRVQLLEPTIRQEPIPPNCGGIPVVEDAWTMDADCLESQGTLLESETYQFARVGPLVRDIAFVIKVKLPYGDGRPTPWLCVADLVILPCAARSPQNPLGEDLAPSSPPPMILVDDVPLGVFVDGGGSTPAAEFLLAVVLPIEELADPFGAVGDLDWFAVVDLDAFGQFYGVAPAPDLDGNGCPDTAIEPSVPGRFVRHAGMDDVGSDLVQFLLNRGSLGLARVDVFEPQPRSLVTPLLAGMQPGESSNSRPWCFNFSIGR